MSSSFTMPCRTFVPMAARGEFGPCDTCGKENWIHMMVGKARADALREAAKIVSDRGGAHGDKTVEKFAELVADEIDDLRKGVVR